MASVLVIHDHSALRKSIVDGLRRNGHEAIEEADFEQACTAHGGAGVPFDVIVVTATVAGGAAGAVAELKTLWPHAEVIVVGQSREISEATEVVRRGAFEYMTSPPNPLHLDRAVRAAAMARPSAPERRPRSRHDEIEDIEALDPLTCAAFAKADRAAAVNCSVLITGESGTGKEVVARRIHRHSARRRAKFVPVNCASLPETLVETELFGYRKGAFTGAVSSAKGLIEEAEGGTLFLDEIGDMPLALQVRLLRFLDTGEIRAVGSTAVRHVDVRVIAATNRCLHTEIAAKRFRADLFFRLSVLSLDLPPLRRRQADLAALVEQELRRAAVRLGIPVPTISPDARFFLLRHSWPGNFRELQNAIEQALVQCTGGVVTPDDLPVLVRRGHSESAGAIREATTKGHLLAALSRNHGNHMQTAAELGISRTTLWRRLREIGQEDLAGMSGATSLGASSVA